MNFERRVALMKPLSATEIEVVQNFAHGLGIGGVRWAAEQQRR
jgi:hypothetical protein